MSDARHGDKSKRRYTTLARPKRMIAEKLMDKKGQVTSRRLFIAQPDVSENEVYQALIGVGADIGFATSVVNEVMDY